MGSIIVSMSISLDGFIEGPNGELDWQLVDEELHQHFNDELAPMRAFLNGRVMHELMVKAWPTADADHTAPPPVKEFARIWRDKPKLVYSRTLRSAEWNAQVVPDVDVDAVLALKAEPGDLALGGPGIAAAFQRLRLVDEYRIYVHPVVLYRGRPLFLTDPGGTAGQAGPGTPGADGVADRLNLELVGTRLFGSGVVLLHYRCPNARRP
jgi:dihydrofolate reductase